MPRADRTTGPRPDREAPAGRRATPATVILLVRHGTTDTTGTELPGRAPGLHLAAAGVRQAEDVAARLVRATPGDGGAERRANGSTGERAGAKEGGSTGGGIAAVYSSPLERTRETAEPIARAVGCDIEIDDALVELDVGEWTGLDLAEARNRPEWATIQRYPSGFTFPGGESFADMQGRMVATLARLRARHPGENVVAVSHADPIRAVVAHAMGTHLDLFQRVVVSPCSITAIALGDEGPIVLTVNATGESALVPS